MGSENPRGNPDRMTGEISPVYDKDALTEIGIKTGKHLRKMRLRAGYTQGQITNDEENHKPGFPSLTTYKDMERGHIATSFETFIQMFHQFHGTDRDAAVLFGNREPGQYVNYSHDSSPGHIARLHKFVRQKYSVLFVDEMDNSKVMTLRFTDIVNNSFVQGTASIGKYSYDCKLLSPVNSEYVFIYFTSTTSMVDRALFVMPEIRWVTGRIKRGIGLMMSISTDGQNCPTIQLFALIHDVYEMPSFEMLKEHLSMKTAPSSEYMIRVPDLLKRNVDFVKKLPLKRRKSSTGKKNESSDEKLGQRDAGNNSKGVI